MFRVIIAGSRSLEDYELVKAYADFKLSNIEDEIEIVSGAGSGADALGERYAKEKGFRIKRFPAEWDKYGRRAGPMRNRLMAEYADALLAYWDGESRGTANMIKEAQARGLKVGIKHYCLFANPRKNEHSKKAEKHCS